MKLMRSAIALSLLPLLVQLSGCSLFGAGEGEGIFREKVATLADLQPAVLPDTGEALPVVDLDTLVKTYRDVLDVSDDPELRLRVLHRLAGLEMKRGEQKLFEREAVGGGEFALAIEAYLTLLDRNPDHPRNDQLLYQLSKAYDLEGKTEQSIEALNRLVAAYSNSPHYGEAQFRRAEYFFAGGDYRSAEQAYGEVINQGEGSVHYANALYMHGWSQFKRERYRASLQSFTALLDLNVPEDNNLESLDAGKRELTRDTFRIMSVVFSSLEGPQTIAEVYNSLGERHYIPLLYDNLGKLYLEQERYKDSAEAYRVFVDAYPQSDLAPVFYASLIDAYIAGGFSEDVLQEKEHYARFYGIHSEYWQQKSEASRDYIRPFLAKYLPELARHYHAKAQERHAKAQERHAQAQQKAAQLTGTTAETEAVKPLSRGEQSALRQQAMSEYLQAGNYYQEFIDTFPTDAQVPEMYYLLAESRFEAEVYDKAIEAYEIVAYKYTNHPRGVAAGYAAIVAYGRLLNGLPEGATNPEHERWLRLKIGSQLRFATTYQQDPRAPAVLTKSAEELLALAEYQHALDAATQLVKREPPAEKELRKTAWLVIGHSEFELQHYVNAEVAYQQTLGLLAKDDPVRAGVVDRLAASVYKQAEQELAAGNAEFAAQEFLRVAQVAPASEISVTAQYDAANTLMNSANWTAAIAVLNAFRRDHPEHPLSGDIPAKMVMAYQESGQWGKAADELTAIYHSSNDAAVKKESLYQAAEFYEKAGDKASAIERYRDYANNYPDPFPLAMEARYRLSELYLAAGDSSKRRYWLEKMIAADQSAGRQRTERSRYLGAMSASVLAEEDYQAFAAIQLKLPLKQSLQKKKAALNTALKSYQNVADYGVQEFATLATWRIGEIYRQLSRDLLDSQRPKNLDELALEQYDLLLEEQAYPFEEKAIQIHEANSRRSWDGVYDQWIKESFNALKKLLPARYDKTERGVSFTDEVY